MKLAQIFGKMSKGGTVVLGGDTRSSTPRLMESARQGLVRSGCQVVDIGQVTTPWLCFARDHLKASGGLMVTASHNPPNENGMKFSLASGPFGRKNMEELQALGEKNISDADVPGKSEKLDLSSAYMKFISKGFENRGRLKVVLDAGGGAAGEMAPAVFRSLGFEVEELFCESGMEKSSRPPDPGLPGALSTLAERVKDSKADLGFGFDGDGDRMVAMAENGRVLASDETLALMAGKVLRGHPGAAIVCDIKMSDAVKDVVESLGGRSVRCPTGQIHVKEALAREKAALAGEYSGHFVLADLSPHDDGILAALFVSFLVQEAGTPLSLLVNKLPHYLITHEIRLAIEEDPAILLGRIQEHLPSVVEIDNMDGIRAVFDKGWGLARASGTENALTFRFEAKRAEDLEDIMRTFLLGVPDLQLAVIEGSGITFRPKP